MIFVGRWIEVPKRWAVINTQYCDKCHKAFELDNSFCRFCGAELITQRRSTESFNIPYDRVSKLNYNFHSFSSKHIIWGSYLYDEDETDSGIVYDAEDMLKLDELEDDDGIRQFIDWLDSLGVEYKKRCGILRYD